MQTFGGVPLDLGSGELKFNSSTIRSSVRNTVPQVYTKAIFPDLLKAVNDLPTTSRLTGTVTKTTARLYLAKSLLDLCVVASKSNNIPTYPASPRTDPDGHDAAWYFQQAYNVATAGIDNPGSNGLVATYYDVNLGQNDRNKEILLYADHTEKSEKYNVSSITYGGGGAPDNFASWMLTWNYPDIRSSGVSSVLREAEQHLGRPWVRMAPQSGFLKTLLLTKLMTPVTTALLLQFTGATGQKVVTLLHLW